MRYELRADLVSVAEQHGVLVVAFAERARGVERYLMLERPLSGDARDAALGQDTHYVEIDSQNCGGYGAVACFELFRHYAIVTFHAPREQRLNGLSSALLTFDLDDDDFAQIAGGLKRIFSGSPIYVQSFE